MIATTLTTKLDNIKSGRYQPTDFIIADAKDGDMAFGIAAPGPVAASPSGSAYKSRADYLDAMKAMAHSGLIDILLMSASSAETLQQDKLFSESSITPAVRLNDTTAVSYTHLTLPTNREV